MIFWGNGQPAPTYAPTLPPRIAPLATMLASFLMSATAVMPMMPLNVPITIFVNERSVEGETKRGNGQYVCQNEQALHIFVEEFDRCHPCII